MKHKVKEVILKGGGRGLLIDTPGAEVATAAIVFRAGYRYTKNSEIYETAHLLEHMMAMGGKNFKSRGEFDAEVTKNGAVRNASTSFDDIFYYFSAADFDFERVLDLEKSAICEPKYTEAEFLREKEVVRTELTGRLTDYWRKLNIEIGIQEDVSPDKRDELQYQQRLENLDNVKLADLKEHYKRTHTRENMRFVIAGDLKDREERIVQMMEDFKIPKGELLDKPAMVNGLVEKPILIERGDAKQLELRFEMNLNRRISDSEAQAMQILNRILNGNLNSRILGEARNKGLVYWSDSGASRGRHTSDWNFAAGVNYDKAGEFFELVNKEFGRIVAGDLSDEEINEAKDFSLGRFKMSGQTVESVAGFYSGLYYLTGEISDYKAVSKRILGVNKEAIVAIAREFIEAKLTVFGAIGNCEQKYLDDLWQRMDVIK
jgi:predicted Zn-dependent peptidase